jgi:hypothetical protein
MQWIVACTMGLVLARGVTTIVGWQWIGELEWLGPLVQVAILIGCVGLMQSWVLAGRCFRKKQWVAYGFAGAVLGALIALPLQIGVIAPLGAGFLRVAGPWMSADLLRTLATHLFSNAHLLLFGAITGLLQSAAVRNDAMTKYRWMTACALGYYLSWVAGWLVGATYTYVGPHTRVEQTILGTIVTGAVLGLITSGPLERILFSVRAESRERSHEIGH